MPTATGRPARRSEARERVLATATELFYAAGINNVGVDRIVRESNVVIATFYRHFPSKEALVVAYLERVHDLIAAQTTALLEGKDGRTAIRALGGDITTQIGQPGFRGCAFMNAATEFENPDSPVRHAVADHRRWYYDVVRSEFAAAGHTQPGSAARHFVMLRDGSMSAAYLDTPTVATRTLKRGVEGLIASIDIEPVNAPDVQDDP